jgi:hypothetical protein
MGCLKLTYNQQGTPFKVVYRKTEPQQKGVQRFLSVDPLAGKFPFYTPYQYTGNNPVTFYDLDGNETTENEVTNVKPNGPQSEPAKINFENYWPKSDETNRQLPVTVESLKLKEPFNPMAYFAEHNPTSTETPTIGPYNPSGYSEDFLKDKNQEFQRQNEFNKILYQRQENSPVMFGNPGQPHGAGGFSALESGMQVYGLIEGGYGLAKLGIGGFKTYSSIKNSISVAKGTFENGNYSLGFSLGKQVYRYLPSNLEIKPSVAFNLNNDRLIYATNLNTTVRTRVYFDLALNIERSTGLNQITNYTQYSAKQWGLYLKGTVGPQFGGIGGGAKQYVGFGLSKYGSIKPSGFAIPKFN